MYEASIDVKRWLLDGEIESYLLVMKGVAKIKRRTAN
jgi:hypothetical protein